MSDKLKPCPFCGGDAHIGTVTYSRPLQDATWADGSPILKAYFGHCASCAAGHRNSVAGGYPTKAAAAAAWNRRDNSKATPTVPPRLDGEMEAL